jgi:1-deoxy-D-xylulose-5-phosphate synthase
MAPSDAAECRAMLTTAMGLNSPSAVRYPRGAAVGEAGKELAGLAVGKGEIRRQGKGVALLAFGAMLKPALEAADALDATVANMRFVKPLDVQLVKRLAETHHLIVTVEEHQIMGGAGSAVCEALVQMKLEKRVLLLGLPDRFIDHGDPARLLASVGLDAEGIRASVTSAISAMPE